VASDDVEVTLTVEASVVVVGWGKASDTVDPVDPELLVDEAIGEEEGGDPVESVSWVVSASESAVRLAWARA
jgi:hypothetical protein